MSVSQHCQERVDAQDPPKLSAQVVAQDRPAEEATFVRDPLRRLPVEVVALIFRQHILSGWSPIVLSSVCRDWRSISFNYPSLWAHIRFGWPSYCGWYATMRSKDDLELTSQWLERSRSLPLHIEFHWPINREDAEHPNGEVDIPLDRELASLLKKFSARWSILALFFVPEDRLRLFFGEDEYFAAPVLEKIRITLRGSEAYGDGLDDGDKIPYLHLLGCSPNFLDIGDIDMSLILIDCKNLTRLSFSFGDDFGPDELIDILRAAPNLELCRVDGTYRYTDRTHVRTMRSPLTHAKLETFSLALEEESILQAFGQLFFRVNFPSLRSLRFCCDEIPESAQTPLFTTFMFFVFKSAASLVNLYIEGVDVVPMGNVNSFVSLLQKLPNLQSLRIADCSSLITDAFFECFEVDIGSDTLSQAVRPFLPLLRTFSYVGDKTFSWTSFQKILRRMDDPPQDAVVLSECRIYLWDDIEMDESLEQRLETLNAAEVGMLENYDDFVRAMSKLGLYEDESKEFCGPYHD